MKKFLIIGNLNAISYKEIFPLIKENKLWLGIPFAAGNAYFSVEDVKEYATGVYDETTGLVKFRNCHWFTNLDHTKRHEPLDYDGVMGVPISFLDKYCPEQFEIIGMMSGVKDPVFANGNDGRAKFYVNDKGVYARILIKSK